MLTILQIGKTHELFSHTDLHNKEHEPLTTIITPNPATADLARQKFASSGHRVESVTIAKFIKEELNFFFDEEILQNFRGKSELSLLLATIWIKMGRESDIVGFQKAFNLLTELRSFSMSLQVFETVLEHYDEYLSSAVVLMHKVLEEMNIIDEHKSYFHLAEKLRSSDFPVEKEVDRKLVFYGFDFMTASQVDLIKSLALRDDIFIPVYKSAYDGASNSDWIKWFDEYNLKILDLSIKVSKDLSLSYEIFSKGAFSKALKEKQGYDSVLLGTKNLTFEYLQEVPWSDSSFKVGVNLFSEALEDVFFEIERLILSSKTKKIKELQQNLDSFMRELVKQAKYRELKCVMIFLTKLNEWQNLSDGNTEINEFELSVLKEAVTLDCPRTNLATLIAKEKSHIKSLSQIDEIKSQKVILGINGQHQGIKGINANYSEGVEKYLASIGPIRRAEFEVNVFKERLREFVEDNNVTLLVESGILKHDMGWNQLLETFDLVEEKRNERVSTDRPSIDWLQKGGVPLKNISASKLQRFYDCPMKYYYSYCESILPRLDYPDEVSSLDLGSIEHKVIEVYFEKEKDFSIKSHEALIHVFLAESVKNKEISLELYQKYFVEVKSFTEKVIEQIFKLKNELLLSLSFEVPFQLTRDELLYRGSIDCVLENDRTNIVLDFKRSNSSFSSFSSILNFEQVQLWFYLSRLKDLGKLDLTKELVFGYINLSDIENSMLFVTVKESVSVWKEFGFKKVRWIEDISGSLGEYTNFETQLIHKIQDELNFLPAPRKLETCGYCDLSNVCSRGGHVNS